MRNAVVHLVSEMSTIHPRPEIYSTLDDSKAQSGSIILYYYGTDFRKKEGTMDELVRSQIAISTMRVRIVNVLVYILTRSDEHQ